MRHAELGDLTFIYGLFASRRDVFPHVRRDKLKRQTLAGQCIFEANVAITYQTYKRRTRVGDIDIPSGAVMLHQIINATQFNGAGSRVFERFFNEIVVPSGGDLYLTVRTENSVACHFYERHGMRVVGNVAWSRGTIPGIIYSRTRR